MTKIKLQDMLESTVIINEDISSKAKKFNSTHVMSDIVFYDSLEETKRFGNFKRDCYATDYAIMNDCSLSPSKVENSFKRSTNYWLRTPHDDDNVKCINFNEM